MYYITEGAVHFTQQQLKKKKITESLKGIHIDFPVWDSD